MVDRASRALHKFYFEDVLYNIDLDMPLEITGPILYQHREQTREEKYSQFNLLTCYAGYQK